MIWAASLGSTNSWSIRAVRTSCPVTRATPRRSAASRCQMSRARCVLAGRSTVRRVRWARAGRSRVRWSTACWAIIRCTGFCRKPVRRSVGAASGLMFTAPIALRGCQSVNQYISIQVDTEPCSNGHRTARRGAVKPRSSRDLPFYSGFSAFQKIATRLYNFRILTTAM